MNIPALTGIRAIAAGIVFLGHMIESHRQDIPDTLEYGWTGVSMFFALSGYLFTWRYADALLDGSFRWGRYIKRRLVRIYPLTTIIILISVLSQFGRYSLPDVALHLALLHSWVPSFRFTINSPMWTLTLEENYYLLAPFFITLFSRIQLRLKYLRPMLLMVAAAWIAMMFVSTTATTAYISLLEMLTGFRDNEAWTFTILGRIPDFVSGMFAAVIARTYLVRGRHSGDFIVLAGIALYVVCINLIIAHGGPRIAGHQLMGTLGFRGIAVSSAIIFYGLHAGGYASRILSTNLMLRLGECSFALYLIQFLPVGSITNIGMYTQRMLEAQGLHFILAACIGYVLFNLAAFGAYRFVERPVATWFRRGND
ncbi:MAG: acyltransferase family protein [Ignavibacteria bacterium]|jgi:peptidoglycan/LPS O-acetylase OafA/YrhL